ncbi:MAG: BamA/TamA family outer membrane protein [Paracoccaceae bacterium]
MWLCAPVDANDSLIEQQTRGLSAEQLQDSPLGFRNGSLIVAPIPFSNPMIGSGLILGGGYLFQLDEGSDPSLIGLGGLRSDNGSQAAAAAVSFKFRDNRWQMSLGGGKADVRYDLYSGRTVIPIRQDGTLARLSLAYGFTPDVSLGFVARYLDTNVTLDTPLFNSLPARFQPNLNSTILNTGFQATWDTRDDPVYPRGGFRLKGSAQRGHILDGIGRPYNKSFALFDTYLSLGPGTVLASRSAICGTTSSAPFFDACSVGGIDAMRGFNATQILDARSLSTQLELRQRVSERLGLVLFAGIGAAGLTFDKLNSSGTAGGLGLRYRVSKKFPVDFSVDASINDLQERQLYISVGQRF